jgi:hypothetical protein
MKRFRITKIVHARDMASALKKDRVTPPVEVSLDQDVPNPQQLTPLIGFTHTPDDDDDDGGD